MTRKIFSTRIKMGAVIMLLTLLPGCSQVIKTGASIALRFSENNVLPPILTIADTDMACVGGDALTPLIMATQSMGADPTKMAVLLYSSAAICAEQTALEAELTYMRESRAGNIEAAQDARILQKRWAETAARRQYAGYQLFTESYSRRYKVKLGDQCPKMRKELDQLVYLLGMMSGLQSLVNDVASGGVVNVPRDIGAIVERSMSCLDDNKFWGTPMAVRAAIWTLLPGAGDGKPDPYQTMKDATRIGEKEGIRLPHAIYALAAQATGRDEIIRDALRTYGKSVSHTAVNTEYALIDALGGLMVRNMSDRYWTEKTGSRTPEGGMLTFWDENITPEVDVNLDDIAQ